VGAALAAQIPLWQSLAMQTEPQGIGGDLFQPLPVEGRKAIRRVIAAYEDPVVRSYSWGRFKILRQRFLSEIGQYLPPQGRVLDVGCGFGLFGLYFCQTNPGIQLQGFDLSEKRIAMARKAQEKLGVENARFDVGDARGLEVSEKFDAVYMLDIVHHVPQQTVSPMLEEVAASLPQGGKLLIKDLDRSPAWQRLFAHALDLAMSPTSPVCYWEPSSLMSLLDRIGFDVKRHAMVDVLPYPHVLYVATKR